MRTSLFLIAFILGAGGAYYIWNTPRATATLGTPIVAPVPREMPLTVGWVGDMVPSDADFNTSAFSSVASLLGAPDLMIGNLEGTFAHDDRLSKCRYILTQCHEFRGDASFADSLKTAGFDFVSLVNNHSFDFGNDGLTDTTSELDRVGIPYITPLQPTASITVKGKKIGILGLSSTEPTHTILEYDFIASTVAQLKRDNDFVIVIMHAGAEGADRTALTGSDEWVGSENRGNPELVAHTAIDAGADLVLGSGPHVLRKIETYQGKTIAYSLGNFVGGNGKLGTNGLLGVTGIFSTDLEGKSPYQFTSVSLSKEGIPSIDITEQGKLLIELLSKK